VFELWVSVHRQHLTCYSLCGKKGVFSVQTLTSSLNVIILKMRKPWNSQTSVWEISLAHFIFHIRPVHLAHPKMKILSLFRRPCVISNPCDFCSFSYREVNSGTEAQHECLTWEQSSLVPACHVWSNMFTIYIYIYMCVCVNKIIYMSIKA